jgi:hypothetical protein
MVQRIKLMADFDCYPLWDMDDGGDIDPTDLPLSEATIERLLNWQKIYDGIIDWDDPASAGFASLKEEIAFERKGISLWCQLKRELGDDYQVFYKSQLHQRVLNPYKSRFGNYFDALLRTDELPQIIQKRRGNLAEKEISKKPFIAHIKVPVTRGKSIEAQGKGRSRTVYEIEFNGAIQYISVEVASNGYIVGANPTRKT